CLLNKHDYDFTPALPVLARCARGNVPVILSSSKTEPEMTQLADELGLSASHLICENGGVVIWRDADTPVSRDVLGVERDQIRAVLDSLRSQFRFRSFSDLGVDGVAEATDLPEPKARQACDRHCTEPLLYEGPAGSESEFKSAIEAAGLTLTRGGRFWHVAGHTTKGRGMSAVLDRLEARHRKHRSIAIGDSPIDQSMLDIADFPIGIPQPDGSVLVSAGPSGLTSKQPGSVGWAETVSVLFDRLGVPE
ncbi:MAG: HAD-IIB family hydrolase, partial [Planctomycetaceae bacterium]